MKFLVCILLVLLFSSVLSEKKAIKALPFSTTTTFTTSPLEAKVTLKPDTILKVAGMKNIAVGVKFPDCGNTFVFFLDLTDFGGSLGKVYTKNITLETPRVCASDLSVQIPGVTACFVVEDLYIFKKTVSGSIVADVGVGVSVLQYHVEAIHLYDFTIGDFAANPCSTKKTISTCVQTATCGWCQSTKKCFEKRGDSRADVCLFCPRCSFFTTSTDADMRAECLSKKSCGWCASKKLCLSGDDLGSFDAKMQCDATLTNADTMQVDWEFTSTNSNADSFGSVSGGTAAFLSILWLAIGAVMGLIVGPVITVGIIFIIFKTKKSVEDTK